ncbi:MAG: hypothetical protein WCD89_02950 [Anaerocolumna sp.]
MLPKKAGNIPDFFANLDGKFVIKSVFKYGKPRFIKSDSNTIRIAILEKDMMANT